MRGMLLFKPRAIHQIVVGYPFYFAFKQFGAYVFYLFGGHPGKYATGWDYCIFKHHSTCGYNAIFTYHSIVHHNCAHTYQHIILHNTTVHYGIMAYGNIITNNCFSLLIGAMDACAILYIYFIADMNTIYITPYNGVEPYATFMPHCNMPYNSGIWSNETIIRYLW